MLLQCGLLCFFFPYSLFDRYILLINSKSISCNCSFSFYCDRNHNIPCSMAITAALSKRKFNDSSKKLRLTKDNRKSIRNEVSTSNLTRFNK